MKPMRTSRHASVTSLTSRHGGWLPHHPRHLAQWMKETRAAAKEKAAPFHPVIREFQEMIESDPVMRMYFTRMFQE